MVEFNFQSTGEHCRAQCRIFGVENSFSALGPDFSFLSGGSYAVELALCGGGGGSVGLLLGQSRISVLGSVLVVAPQTPPL